MVTETWLLVCSNFHIVLCVRLALMSAKRTRILPHHKYCSSGLSPRSHLSDQLSSSGTCCLHLHLPWIWRQNIHRNTDNNLPDNTVSQLKRSRYEPSPPWKRQVFNSSDIFKFTFTNWLDLGLVKEQNCSESGSKNCVFLSWIGINFHMISEDNISC